MANKPNRRRNKMQAKLNEALEIERRVYNLLIECYSEIIDDILPIEYMPNHVCEHYRGRRDVNYMIFKNFEDIFYQILIVIIQFFIVVLILIGLPLMYV